MGNTQTYSGGLEVPITDKTPWGVANVNMMIPLDFANRLRDPSTDLNAEYKQFIAHRVYELIPGFIDMLSRSVDYNIWYWSLLRSLNMHSKTTVINTVKLTKLRALTIRILKLINESAHSQNDVLDLHTAWSSNIHRRIPQTYPNWFNPIIDTIPTPAGDVLFTDHPAFINVAKYQPNNHNLVERDLTRQVTDADIYDDKLHYIQSSIDLRNVSMHTHGMTIIPVSWCDFEYGGAHAVSVIADHTHKLLYITDSNGLGVESAEVGTYMCQWFTDYKTVHIMPPSVCPRAFQSIAEDEFCQTWTLIISLLTIANHFDDPNDINEKVFNEIIDHAKPLISVNGMNQKTKLGLIIIEFMFYIYKSLHTQFVLFCENLLKDHKVTSTHALTGVITINNYDILNPPPEAVLFPQVFEYIDIATSLRLQKLMSSFSYSKDLKLMIKTITIDVSTDCSTYDVINSIVSGKIGC